MEDVCSYSSVVEGSCERVRAYYESPSCMQRLLSRGGAAPLYIGGLHGCRVNAQKPYTITYQCSRGKISASSYEITCRALSDHKTEVTTCVRYQLHYGFLGRSLARKIQEKIYRELFHTHLLAQEDRKHYHLYPHAAPLKVLLSGASGFVGNHLVNLLPLFACDVFTLVRKESTDPKEIFWDPYHKTVDLSRLEGFDAVIHLSGENVGAFRWTKKKKQAIKESRLLSTRFLVESFHKLSHPPKSFFCASAIGFYGDCAGKVVDETAPSGQGFLAEVSADWEEEAKMFSKGRVVSMRFGTVLGSQGGLLQKFTTLLHYGFSLQVGSGEEKWSWISLEDLGYQILHLLRKESIQGAVNMTTPYPVTTKEFAATLAKVLHVQWPLPMGRKILQLMMGEAAEGLLTSIQAMPRQLENTQSYFSYPRLEEALRCIFNKYEIHQ